MTLETVRQPKWADFPVEEYATRTQKAQRLMAEQNLDVLLLTQRENIEYFSGFLTGHWNSKLFPPAVLLIHRSQDPILVLPDFFNGTAEGSSWVARRILHAEPHADPRKFPERIVEGITEMGATTGTVGLESGEILTPRWNMLDYEYVRSHLSSATFRSGSEVIWQCRMIKSPREIERMRSITALTDRSIMAVKGAVHVGMTEQQVAQVVFREMIDGGADGYSFMNIRAGLDRYPMADSLPMPRPVAEGEMLLVDVGTNYRSYVTDVAYVAHIGRPTSKHHEIYETVIRAQEAAIAVARPGVKASEVFRTSLRVLEDLHFGKLLDMVGHGIGMDPHEPPMLTPYDDRLLEPGMCFAIEPWIYDTANLGFFCVEEIVVVTEDEPVVLSSVPRDELWTVE